MMKEKTRAGLEKVKGFVKTSAQILLMIYLIDTIGFKRGVFAYVLMIGAWVLIPIIFNKDKREEVISLYMSTIRQVEFIIWGRTLDNRQKGDRLPKVKVVWGKKDDTKSD